MKKFSEVKEISGYLTVRRSSTCGYTARVEELNVDGNISRWGRSKTMSGGNYDKFERALWSVLREECEGLPSYIPYYSNFEQKHFFGTHYFELKDGKIEIY